MNIYKRIQKINDVLTEYFKKNPYEDLVPAKNFMSLFIEQGVCIKDA